MPILSRFAGLITAPALPPSPEPDPYSALEQEITYTEKIIAATARRLRSIWKSKHFWRPFT